MGPLQVPFANFPARVVSPQASFSNHLAGLLDPSLADPPAVGLAQAQTSAPEAAPANPAAAAPIHLSKPGPELAPPPLGE